jgi:menaquinol-cytochrome c reductase iron-sulfur subunit
MLSGETAHRGADATENSPMEDTEAGPLEAPSGTRRTFFQWATTAAATLIGLGLAIPLVGYLVGPAFKRREQTWVDVGEAGSLTAGEPTQLDYMATARDGWMESKTHKAVWAVKQSDADITVFSPMCTHLGCGYRWDAGEKKFLCPCHGSVYNVKGEVLAGPAPRSLDTLPAKLENGRLFVQYKEFRSGLSRKVEL